MTSKSEAVVIVGVKDLAGKIGVAPIKVRRVLRAEGIKPKKIEVPEGWPNQKRRQYLWEITDPELTKVLIALAESFKVVSQS